MIIDGLVISEAELFYNHKKTYLFHAVCLPWKGCERGFLIYGYEER